MILTWWANRWWGTELKSTNFHPATQAANKDSLGLGIWCQIHTVKEHLRANVSLLCYLPVGLYLAPCFICWKAHPWSHGKSESHVLLSSGSKALYHREVTMSRADHWGVAFPTTGKLTGDFLKGDFKFHWQKRKGEKVVFYECFHLKCFKYIMATLSMNFEVFWHLW